MTIQIGDSLPNVSLKQITPDGFQDVSTATLFQGKTIALFAIPGAFTPTCTTVHLPGFSKKMDQFKAKGIDVYCIAVNDPFVLSAWGKYTQAHADLGLLADWNAEFTKAIGMNFDGSGAGLGLRSKRYSMLIKDGIIKNLNIEEKPGECSVSSADHLLEII